MWSCRPACAVRACREPSGIPVGRCPLGALCDLLVFLGQRAAQSGPCLCPGLSRSSRSVLAWRQPWDTVLAPHHASGRPTQGLVSLLKCIFIL